MDQLPSLQARLNRTTWDLPCGSTVQPQCRAPFQGVGVPVRPFTCPWPRAACTLSNHACWSPRLRGAGSRSRPYFSSPRGDKVASPCSAWVSPLKAHPQDSLGSCSHPWACVSHGLTTDTASPVWSAGIWVQPGLGLRGALDKSQGMWPWPRAPSWLLALFMTQGHDLPCPSSAATLGGSHSLSRVRAWPWALLWLASQDTLPCCWAPAWVVSVWPGRPGSGVRTRGFIAPVGWAPSKGT